MIKIRIRNGDDKVDIRFPISESELIERLADIHAVDSEDEPPFAYISAVHWPEEFSVLTGRYTNLDELNYLAKRMESFDTLEMDQFLIGITKLDDPTVKDLINLTFNLNRFTLVKDVGSYGKIGRTYVLNTEGCVPAHDEDDPKYAAIGKDLIDRGLAQITERGLLIYNPLEELDELYDGHTFPGYYYTDSLLSLDAEYSGRIELLQLPNEPLAIQKAIRRLGASCAGGCRFTVAAHNIENDAFLDRINMIISEEGIYEANTLLKALDTDDMDWDKLTAVVELVEVSNSENITVLTEHLDEFEFVPGAKSSKEVGRFLVDTMGEYELNIAMEPFFDFPAFGEFVAKEYNGHFVSNGFVYYTGDGSMDELFEQLDSEDVGMSMGGM